MVVAVLSMLYTVYCQTAYQVQQTYYSTLLDLYMVNNRSTSDFIARVSANQFRTVNVQAFLLALHDVDEVEGALELSLSLQLTWVDEVVQASGHNHSSLFDTQATGIKTLQIPAGKIWTPNIVLFNSVDSSATLGGAAYMPTYNFENGTVSWSPIVKVRSSCSPDVTYYPFDRQTCRFDFVAWGTSTSELQFRVSRTSWDMMFYEGNGEWEIDQTDVSTHESSATSYLRLSITMARKPLYFAFNIILPVLVLVALNGMVFWLPEESGERIGFSVTCFLSFVVLLNMIMDILPRSSSPMAYLCFYAVSMMIFSGATTAVVILQLRMFHKPDKEKVPRCLQKFVLFLRCRCRKRSIDIQDKEIEKGLHGPKKSGFSKKIISQAEPQVDEEEEITWADLARFLDKFLFLAFVGGQTLFTILFIAPVAANA